MYFNSHAHVERDLMCGTNFGGGANFNSHAHVERDFQFDPYCLNIPISTHTLTWSVTIIECALKFYNDISTHTLTWSVTTTHKTFMQ